MERILRSCIPDFETKSVWNEIQNIDLTEMAATGAHCLADDGLYRLLEQRAYVFTDPTFNIEAADSDIQADNHLVWHMEMRTKVKEALAERKSKFDTVYHPRPFVISDSA